jgi:hypothetical protein
MRPMKEQVVESLFFQKLLNDLQFLLNVEIVKRLVNMPKNQSCGNAMVCLIDSNSQSTKIEGEIKI